MAKSNSNGRPSSIKFIFILFFTIVIGAALVSDLLWASMCHLHSSSSNWVVAKRPGQPTLPVVDSVFVESQTRDILLSRWSAINVDERLVEKRRDPVRDRNLSATFMDLNATELQWEEMPSAPVARLDGAAVQIGDLLYVFAGYRTIDYVNSNVDVYNFTDNTWCGKFDMPKEMAHSHLGMASDGRYIYVVTGQYGPQCRGPVAHTFVLDTMTKEWRRMPPLPAPRYAPATQLWRGRLHVMGGSKEDRYEPALEHWSIAVKDGRVLENDWHAEIPIPRGGPHRACIVVDDRLFVIGGQEGDFMAKPGSPIFKCSRRHEKWSVIGKMPFRVKTTLVGFWDGWLYFTSGQRDRGPDDPSPRKVIGNMFRTKLSF
ncbi:hypothetical protein Sjap_023350 [Stephania japonica]|uniref:Kelch repeat-containing protein n=1 Tax=Stephania japonica TaxID=461633 RepID=A0AAP0EIP5_9MAGN